jgi:hypothetical protein
MNATTVTVSTLQQTIARAIAKYPRERARIEKAATLVALGAVTITADAATVASQTGNGTVYAVTTDGCECVDAQRRPGQSCKHRWAVDIVLVAQERQRRLDARQHLNAEELARLIAWKRERSAVAA